MANTDTVLKGSTSATNVTLRNDDTGSLLILKDATQIGKFNSTGGVSGSLVQRVEATPYTTSTALSTVIPADDTIPQITEGTEILTVAITPKSATNRLVIRANLPAATNSVTGNWCIAALFQDATANALATSAILTPTANYLENMAVVHEMAAGTTSSTTFRIRVGGNSGNVHLNGITTGRFLGGLLACRLSVEEIAA